MHFGAKAGRSVDLFHESSADKFWENIPLCHNVMVILVYLGN